MQDIPITSPSPLRLTHFFSTLLFTPLFTTLQAFYPFFVPEFTSSFCYPFRPIPRLLSVPIMPSLLFGLQNSLGRHYALLSKAWLPEHASSLVQQLRRTNGNRRTDALHLRSPIVVFSVLQHPPHCVTYTGDTFWGC
jgi:hypothetical protein